MKKTLQLSALIFVAVHCLSAQASEDATIRVQKGHTADITSIVFSPDGKYAASGSEDNTIVLWDLGTAKEIRTFRGHTKTVYSVLFSSDGKKIVSRSMDHTAKLWDVETGRAITGMFEPSGLDSFSALSRDGKYILEGLFKFIRVYDAATGTKIRELNGRTPDQYRLYPLQDPYSAALKTRSGKEKNSHIDIWDKWSGQVVKTLGGLDESIHSVNFSPDYSMVICTYGDKKIRVWSRETGNQIWDFEITPQVMAMGNYFSATITADNASVIVSSKERIAVLDFKTKAVLGSIVRPAGGSSSSKVAISPDSQRMLISSENGMSMYDLPSLRVSHTYKGHTGVVNRVTFSPDGRLALAAYETKNLILWDLQAGKRLRTFRGHQGAITAAAFFPDGKGFISSSEDTTLKIWSIEKEKAARTLSGHQAPVTSVAVSKDGRYAVSGSQDFTVRIWDVRQGKQVKALRKKRTQPLENAVTSVVFSPDGKYVVVGYDAGSNFRGRIARKGQDCTKEALEDLGDANVILWDISTGKEKKKMFMYTHNVYSVDISPDGKYAISTGLPLVVPGDEDIQAIEMTLWNLSNGCPIKNFEGHDIDARTAVFSPDGRSVLSGSSDLTVRIWDTATGKVTKSLAIHTSRVNSVAISPNGKFGLSGSDDTTMILWDLSTGHWLSFLGAHEDERWLIFDASGYWDASANGGELVAMVQGMSVRNIDQFAVKNNRPDVILGKVDSTDEALISHYAAQYQKRLRKLGLTEAQLSDDYHVPTSEITSSKLTDKHLELGFYLADTKHRLKRYNVYVNDVPLFGSYGKEISGHSANLVEKIELTSGQNKIEVSCMNEAGTESYRAATTASYGRAVKGDLYFLGFGVSRYQDQVLNLRYADKDTKDLAEVFSRMKGEFGNTKIRTFLNEEVTVESIKKAKDFLKDARPDDTFVLFIAGHGVHDTSKEATYYYVTHDTDTTRLADTAASFEYIEDILQGVQPRKKLFLMDTCESGEVDDSVQNAYFAMADKRGIKTRAITRERGLKVVKKAQPSGADGLEGKGNGQTKRAFLHDRGRYIYNDLVRRSGAIVFSSSRGGEFSYESDKIRNGFFTSSIVASLTSQGADKNNDGVVTVDELREFVATEVPKLTDAQQNPTVDRDNLYQRFGFPIVKK